MLILFNKAVDSRLKKINIEINENIIVSIKTINAYVPGFFYHNFNQFHDQVIPDHNARNFKDKIKYLVLSYKK
jgi:hypothetical protein